MWRYIHQCVVKLSFKQILCQRDIKKKAMVFVKLISLNIWSTLMYICFPWVIHQKLKLVHTVLKSEYFVKNETVINLLQFWVSCQKLSAWKKTSFNYQWHVVLYFQTFRPKKRFEPGTMKFNLHKQANASLNSGIDLKEVVKLPPGEDMNDWIAVHGGSYNLKFIEFNSS